LSTRISDLEKKIYGNIIKNKYINNTIK